MKRKLSLLASVIALLLNAGPVSGSQYAWVEAQVTTPSGVTNYGGQNYQSLNIKTSGDKDLIKAFVQSYSGNEGLYTEAEQVILGEVENKVVNYFYDTFTVYPRDSNNNPMYVTSTPVLITVSHHGVFYAPAAPFFTPFAEAWFSVYEENHPTRKLGLRHDTSGGGWGAPGWSGGYYGTNIGWFFGPSPYRKFYWGEQITLRFEFGARAKNGAIVDSYHTGMLSFGMPEGTGTLSVASKGGYRLGNPPTPPIPSLLLLLSRAFKLVGIKDGYGSMCSALNNLTANNQVYLVRSDNHMRSAPSNGWVHAY
jgi:hypothetical protein